MYTRDDNYSLKLDLFNLQRCNYNLTLINCFAGKKVAQISLRLVISILGSINFFLLYIFIIISSHWSLSDQQVV